MNRHPLPAYLAERFPFVNMALFAVLFGTVYSAARFFGARYSPGFVVSAPGASGFGWREVGGMVAVISFFFRLRVFDEQKDFDLDCLNHPQRVLQSGRITLGRLVRIAGAGLAVELLWSILMGLPTLVTWLLAVGYSVLMRYEFFRADYLKKRLLFYAVTHMLIMPLVIGWVWSAYAPVCALAPFLLLLAALSLLGGFSFEIARKLHAPDAERPLVDSYSKTLGYAPAIILVLFVLLVSVGVQSGLLVLLQAGALPFWLLGGLYLTTLVVYGFALATPAEKTLKTAGLLVSLFMVVSYLSIIFVIHAQ